MRAVQQQMVMWDFWFGPLRALLLRFNGGSSASSGGRKLCELLFATIDNFSECVDPDAVAWFDYHLQLMLCCIYAEPLNEGDVLRVRAALAATLSDLLASRL